MILQTLDINKNCLGIFCEGRLYFEKEKMAKKISSTKLAWKHSPILKDEKHKYLFLLAKQRPLHQFSPNREDFIEIENTLSCQSKALKSAKVDMSEGCLFDAIPDFQVEKYFSLREEALFNLLKIENFSQDYEILHKAHVLASTISKQDILFDQKKRRICYNIFGSATGRLTTEKGSLPILSLKKEQRALVKPSNDLFLEIDLNAAEVRTLLALSGKPQPPGDIHEWISTEVYKGKLSREESKIKLFSWLYNFSSSDIELSKFFSRQIFRDFYCPEKQILKTPFGRQLKVEERKAQNYLLQSTTSDIVIENAYKIVKFLKEKKTKLAFTLHDSIVLDMAKEDIKMIRKVKKIFDTNKWGVFSSTCKLGKDFGNMRRIEI